MVDVIIPNMPNLKIDDDAIAAWIEGRLDDAHELFIRQMDRGGGTGRIYRRGGRRHQASAPGEYPVTDGGRLVNSVHPELTGPREGTLWSDLKYADYLTTGTRYMDARRMLADAINEVMADRPETDLLAKAARIT